MKEYVNSESISNPIEIKLRTTRNWIHKLGFEYKDVKKDVFIDKHERPDVIQDCENFLKVMKELEPYLVEFNEDGRMKNKEYPLDCAIKGAHRRLVIVITHDERVPSPQMMVLKEHGQKKVTVFFAQKEEDKVLWPPNFCYPLEVLIYLLYLRRKKKKL